jgi:hypothetical protein
VCVPRVQLNLHTSGLHPRAASRLSAVEINLTCTKSDIPGQCNHRLDGLRDFVYLICLHVQFLFAFFGEATKVNAIQFV